MSEVSVIVPSFRGGKFLREAIASVRAQSLMDWELIIVLDGCDEDLSDIEGIDSRVRVIRQDRRGVSIARNVGISHARSDLIALLDDDDRMLPNRLVAQSREMRDERVAICHTQYRYIDGEGNVLRPGDAKATTYIEFLRNESKILSATAMFRKRTFQEMGGYNSLIPFGEGQDFFQRVSREGEVRFIPEVLYEYRQHESNVWLGGASGYEETAWVLRQHLFAARARKDELSLRAVRYGLSTIPPRRVSGLLRAASRSRAQHRVGGLVGALLLSTLLAPVFTARATYRELKRGGLRGRS